MSTPFINPYETKDVVSTSLNNLDKQSQDIVSYLDGLFSSETIKDRQLILDDGTVETLKPFEVANNQGAFWDKGTTYYFQPVADRLREISLEIQGRLSPTDVSASLKAGIMSLFSKTLDDSKSQVSNNGTDQYANNWTYEQWYTNTSDPNNPINKALTLDDFLNAVGTATFKMVDAASDENAGTKAITNNTGLKININLEGIAELLDDGDNFYNDNNTINDPNTAANEGVHDSNKQPEFYLIGNRKLPVFGNFENAPDPTDLAKYPGGITSSNYKQDLYNYQNKRIDPNNIYWNDPNLPKEPEEVFYDMVAIAITQQKALGSFSSADPAQIRSTIDLTAQTARDNLKNIAGSYFTDSIAWYNSAAPRNLDTNTIPKPPAFLLGKSTGGTIDYSSYDGFYGTFKPTDTGSLADLISQATGINATAVNATLTNWNWNGFGTPPAGISNALIHSINVEKITKYYTQSYISASLTSTFGKKDSAISTKNFLIHEALNNLDPSQNPYLQEAGDQDVVKFDKLLTDVPTGYLRNSGDPANTHMSNQMTQLMDLFLENFDITANRYVEDKRTLVDLFSGKLLKTAGENAEVQKSLFQNINSTTKDITSQIKNTLTRGIPESAESQFTLDLFNQTAVRKEDYGLSPNPADPTENFLPSSWASMKDKYLPAMYYYNPANPIPISGSDEANNTLNDTTIAKNGLPAGFPIMDVRDFDQFFKATKLALTSHIKTYLNANPLFVATNNLATLSSEMDSFLTDPTVLGTYPSWTAAGFTAGSEAAIFGDLSDQTDFSRAIQLYKSLDKTIVNMENRVSSVGQSVPKIPRPINSNVISPSTGLPVTLTLQSSTTGYGDKPSPALVKNFLEMHEATSAVSTDPNADSLNRISYLINTFDNYSKFSQNSAFETIYAGEVFEADKQNYSNLNQKRPEPGPDGSMPEDKSVPKPLMAALNSSVLVTKLGQILTNKVNDLVQENNVISINNVDRGGLGVNVGNIDITNTQLSGSKESQTYLTNILKQISSLSTGNLSVDVSTVGALISNNIETAMQTLITNTDDDAHRMIFIDDKTIDELETLRMALNGFSPTGALLTLKNLLTAANLSGLKTAAYPAINATNNAPGYLPFNSLTTEQKNLIKDIRDGKFSISGSTYTINGTAYTLPATNIVPVDVPDNILNTLGTLATNISAMLNASTTETPPRIVNIGADPILSEINNAKLNFTALTASADTAVAYNAILDAGVYEAGVSVPMASLLRSDANGGNAADRAKASATIQARKDLLAGLLQANNKEVGGKLIDHLDKNDPLNPYRNLLVPVAYTNLDPANLVPPLPSTLTSITTNATFQTHIGNIETFISGVQNSLNNAKNETPPRDITLADDPILALSQLAQLNLSALKDPTNSIWVTPLNHTNIKNAIINSDVGGAPIAGNLNKTNIQAARTKLLEFFLENKLLNPAASAGPNNYKITEIKTHTRYKNLITPETYTYPSDITFDATTGLGSFTASTTPFALNSTVNNSKADSFTLREVMGCDKNFAGGDVPFRNAAGTIIGTTDDGFPNSLNDLEFKMRNVTGEFTGAQGTANKQLYIRKMQHFNILFNTLSGGTAKNPPLAAFGTPPELFASGTQNLNQYIESLTSDTTIINSTAFQNIVAEVAKLAPVTENINALEVSLAGEIKKPKSGPESEIYSTIHLLTQIENQTNSTPANYEAGILQLLNQRNIKDGTNIVALEHRAATAIAPKDGLYQYSGYAANLQYLDPTNPLSISGPNIAPATTGNQGWNIKALLTTKGIASGDFPPFTAGTNPSGLIKARDFLVALNEVYKDMQASKSPVIKEQLKVFDLWLRNNSFSPIGDAALRGKDSLEADINILDHIQEGGGTNPTTINSFLSDSKIAASNNKQYLEDLDDIRTAGKGFGQRINDGLSATELKKYFQENIFYPSGTTFPNAGVQDTRTDYTKDRFGRTLDNSNLPVFGVNIFGTDPKTGITYDEPIPLPALPDPIGSNSYKNFGLTGLPTLDNPYEKIMDNINTLLTALTAAETAGRYKEVSLYRTMIKNLLGESGGVPDAALIAAALAENPARIAPGDPSLVDAGMGLTYGTNNYPSVNLRTKVLDARRTLDEAIDPAKYTGPQPIPNATLVNFALSSKADQATTIRSVGVEGKSIQELAVLLYIMQMFEQSNWDFEKYLNDTSRYEIEAAVE
jgi:hypothetical protein